MHTAQVSALLLRLPPPSTSFMVREQIHFWFSPQNLAKDRFLQAQIAKSKERCAYMVVVTHTPSRPHALFTAPHTPLHPFIGRHLSL